MVVKSFIGMASGITVAEHLSLNPQIEALNREYLRGKYHCTVDLLFD
jgi:hypothetical protein